MPTGYTADLYDGKEVPFETFVLQCARAFGATILLRDHDVSVLPTVENVNDSSAVERYEDGLREARQRLNTWRLMSEETLLQATRERNEQTRADYAKARRQDRDRLDAYNDMLTKVLAWDPPSEDHVGLKEFMEQQLRASIKHDISGPEWNSKWYRQLRPEEYRAEQIASAESVIKWKEEALQKERELAAGRERWMRELLDSLGIEAKEATPV